MVWIVLISLCGVLGGVIADDPPGPTRRVAEPRFDADQHRVGEWIADFDLVGMDARPVKSVIHAKGESGEVRPLLIIARESSCPLCKRYGPELARLEREFGERVAFVFLNLSEVDRAPQYEADRSSFGFRGLYAVDPTRDVAARLGITSTTEVLLIDSRRTLRYRGAVDDRYGIGYAKEHAQHTYLRDALVALLTGKPIPVLATTAPGCVIESGSPRPKPMVAPTYHNRVSRIVQSRCQGCHRAGGVAPFPLETYAQVKGRRGMIRDVVEDRLMPPWFADESTGPWENDWSLTERERRDLMAWVDGESPEGDPSAAPTPVAFASSWMIGEPDLVLEIPEAYSVPAEGVIDYVYRYVQSPLTEDRWIESMEIRPTASDVVHHVLVFLEEPRREGEDARSFRRRFRGGLRGYFAGMVPGQGWTIYPEGLGKKLPAKAWLKFQIHYTPKGVAAEDRTRIAFRFRDAPPEREMSTSSVATTRFRIPARAENHRVDASLEIRRARTLYSFAPHMHVRGKAFRYELELPSGEKRVLLDVPRYDFNWQMRYRLRQPIAIPAGAILKASAWFDNSENNPANPNPNVSVRFGEQTFDEMMIGYFEWY